MYKQSLTYPSGFPEAQPAEETKEVTPIWTNVPSLSMQLMAEPLSPYLREFKHTFCKEVHTLTVNKGSYVASSGVGRSKGSANLN